MSDRYPDPCPDTGRRRVTVAEGHARPDSLVDTWAYWFNPEARALGLECWKLVEGTDAHTRDGLYDVDFANGTYRTARGDEFLYINPKDYEALQCGK